MKAAEPDGVDDETVDGAKGCLQVHCRREQLDPQCERIWVTLHNASASIVAVDEVQVMRLSLNGPGSPFEGAQELRFLEVDFRLPGLTTNFGVISKAGVHLSPHERDDSWRFENEEWWIVRSDPFLAVSSMDRQNLLLAGAGTFRVAETETHLLMHKSTGEAVLRITQRLDGKHLPPDGRLELDDLLQCSHCDVNRALVAWAEHTASASDPPPRVPETVPAGWSDWQFYKRSKTQDIVLDNARALAALRDQGFPVDYIVVDDGFCVGTEWERPNAAFADGMAALSEKIRALGLNFGLWFAPYTQSTESTVVREHPEWLLRDRDGEIVTLKKWTNVGPACLIDYSIPGAEAWLRRYMRLLTQDWQVKWIKIDGPRYVWYREGVLRRQGEVNITEMFCRSLQVMREEAAPDVLLEGEGPLGVALGKVDLHRVQGDNFTEWYRDGDPERPVAPKSYSRELMMSFLHNRWWVNHRQDVILRDFPSPYHPDPKPPVFSRAEMNTELTATLFGSGTVLLCDPVRQLLQRPHVKPILRRLLPVQPEACEIVDAFPEERWPSVFRQARKQGFALAVINWGDEPGTVDIDGGELPAPAADCRVFDFFGDRRAEVKGDRLIVALPARDAVMVEAEAHKRETGGASST